MLQTRYLGKHCREELRAAQPSIGDNVHLENCIVESRGTINPNTCYCGEDGVMIVKKNVKIAI